MKSASWVARGTRAGVVVAAVATLGSSQACSGDDPAPGQELDASVAPDAAPPPDASPPDASAPDAGPQRPGLRNLARVDGKVMVAEAADGSRLYGWGANTFQLLRAGGSGQYAYPVELAIEGLPPGPWRQVVNSGDKMCVLAETGNAWCWGDTGANDSLGVGDGEPRAAATPLAQGEIPEGVKLTTLALSAFTSCAVGDDGEAYCWGDFRRVPDLDPSLETVNVPTRILRGDVPGGAKILDVATNVNRSCVLADDGRAYCWYLGQPELIEQGELPYANKLLALSLTDEVGCAAADDGEVYCWGSGFGRRFGRGSEDYVSNSAYLRIDRSEVPSGVRFTAVTVGGIAGASCALGSDGWAYCWGDGGDGSVGDGNLEDHDVLRPRAVLRGAVPEGVTFVRLGCGTYHCTAEGSDHVMYAWGHNESGVLATTLPDDGPGATAEPVRMEDPRAE